jgi:gamma-glutamylcysteine synthetase
MKTNPDLENIGVNWELVTLLVGFFDGRILRKKEPNDFEKDLYLYSIQRRYWFFGWVTVYRFFGPKVKLS